MNSVLLFQGIKFLEMVLTEFIKCPGTIRKFMQCSLSNQPTMIHLQSRTYQQAGYEKSK